MQLIIWVIASIVLAMKENTKDVGWLITEGDNLIKDECNIPFYDTVKEGDNSKGTDWRDQPEGSASCAAGQDKLEGGYDHPVDGAAYGNDAGIHARREEPCDVHFRRTDA